MKTRKMIQKKVQWPNSFSCISSQVFYARSRDHNAAFLSQLYAINFSMLLKNSP